MNALIAIEAIVIVLLTILVAGLLRSHAEILRRLHAMGAGEDFTPTSSGLGGSRPPKALSQSPVETITGVTPSGSSSAVALSDSRGMTLLAFLSSGCNTCQTFWRAFDDGEMNLPGEVRTVVVTKSPKDESLSQIQKLAPSKELTIMSTEAWDEFAVPYTPYFVLIDASRGAVVGDGSSANWAQLSALIERGVGDQKASKGRTTTERLIDSDRELADAGIEPGDSSLFHKPADDS